MRRMRFIVVVLACLGIGCGDEEGGVGPKVKDHSQYTIESSFDVQGDFGGSQIGEVLNMLRDMSDGADDPGRYCVDQLIEFLPTPLDWAAEPFAEELGGEVNDLIYSLMPTVADEIKEIASGLSSAARKFEMSSFLDVGLDAKDRYTGSHELRKLVYAYQENTMELAGVELGTGTHKTDLIPIHLEGDSLVIDQHDLKLPLGSALRKALDRVVVPAVVQDIAGIVDLVARWFACAEIAATIADKIDGAEATVLEACISAAGSVSEKITGKIAELDKQGGLRLSGSAEADTGGVDYQGGGWSGTYLLGKDNAALDPQKCPFTAEKATATP